MFEKNGGEPGEDGAIRNIGTILQKAPVRLADDYTNETIGMENLRYL